MQGHINHLKKLAFSIFCTSVGIQEAKVQSCDLLCILIDPVHRPESIHYRYEQPLSQHFVGAIGWKLHLEKAGVSNW